MKTIRQLLLCLTVLLCFNFISELAAKEKFNVLFIAVDDLKPELGCYGKDYIHSPNMDQLAKEGMVFNNHFVQVPTCGASRFTLLTGQRPSLSVHISNEACHEIISGKPEGESPESFIHHFKRNGYYTVGISKISHYTDGLLYGYNEPTGTERELPHSWDELCFDAGKWETGWNAFFGYADGSNRQSMNRQVKPYEKADVSDEGYVDGLTANLAIQKMKELAKKEQPFFLGVGFVNPHLPFNAPSKYWDMYNREDIPLSPYADIPENVNKKSLHSSGELNGYKKGEEKASLNHSVSDDYARKLKHAYFASVSYTDAQIGKLLKELEALGLEENTIVVIWGDHGWHLGDKRVWGKHSIFEDALKSALIIKVPGMKKSGQSSDAIVETVDIYPTLLDLCNLPNPKGIQLSGKSMKTLLNKSNDKKWDHLAYSYFREGISVRTAKYRLTKYFRNAQPVVELYDHKNDPNETKNIADLKPEIVSHLMPLWEKGNTGVYGK